MGQAAARLCDGFHHSQSCLSGELGKRRDVHYRFGLESFQLERVRALRRHELDEGCHPPFHPPVHGEPHLRTRDSDPGIRVRLGRRAGCARARSARGAQRYRHGGVELRQGSPLGGALRPGQSGRQGGVQGGPAKGDGIARAARCASFRRFWASHSAKGLRCAGTHARPHFGLESADGLLGLRRCGSGRLLCVDQRTPGRQIPCAHWF